MLCQSRASTPAIPHDMPSRWPGSQKKGKSGRRTKGFDAIRGTQPFSWKSRSEKKREPRAGSMWIGVCKPQVGDGCKAHRLCMRDLHSQRPFEPAQPNYCGGCGRGEEGAVKIEDLPINSTGQGFEQIWEF